ncbi:MAG: DUF4351 domain-containing protein [Desulfobacterales bacterium]|nr:DUF4351 domain-containing protein [Desulfobacterales bacterium]
MPDQDKKYTFTNDQNFKNLIVDYPRESLEFFAAEEAGDMTPDVRITPVRQEQLKDRLGDHFHELDTPLLAEWPDGKRKAILFVLEEETKPASFSIHRAGRYCLHLSEMFKTDRVVPAVIFLRPGNYPTSLTLGGDWKTYMFFSYIVCDLGRIPAEMHMESNNIVARLNLPNMAYQSDQKIGVYANALDGLAELEKNPERRIKYSEFIDLYAKLDEKDVIRYRKEYLPKSQHKEELMGFTQMMIDKGRKQGKKEGEVLVLKRQISRRFGTVPVWAEDRLKQAEQKDLEIWIDRILDAGSVEEVFKN